MYVLLQVCLFAGVACCMVFRGGVFGGIDSNPQEDCEREGGRSLLSLSLSLSLSQMSFSRSFQKFSLFAPLSHSSSYTLLLSFVVLHPHIHIYTYTHLSVHTSAYTHTHLSVHTRVDTYTHVHTHVNTHIHTCAYLYTHSHSPPHIHSRTYRHTLSHSHSLALVPDQHNRRHTSLLATISGRRCSKKMARGGEWAVGACGGMRRAKSSA
jgi:hypothetical protein